MRPSLVILAAGMGSRYGGLKQLDAFGPNGETIIDYSLFDAIQAGFEKIVFVIRESFRDNFIRVFESKLEGRIEFDFVCQELEMLPNGYRKPMERTKPWGTAHAVNAAKQVVDGPFGVINADDFYGRESYAVLVRYFDENRSQNKYAIVAYSLNNTLSEHGTVNRGLCRVSEDGYLENIREIVKISRNIKGEIVYPEEEKTLNVLSPNSIVSMNFFGFYPSYFAEFDEYFGNFLNDANHLNKGEYYIPTYLDQLIADQKAKVKVLESGAEWFGVTYRSDRDIVQDKILHLIQVGQYPESLWM